MEGVTVELMNVLIPDSFLDNTKNIQLLFSYSNISLIKSHQLVRAIQRLWFWGGERQGNKLLKNKVKSNCVVAAFNNVINSSTLHDPVGILAMQIRYVWGDLTFILFSDFNVKQARAFADTVQAYISYSTGYTMSVNTQTKLPFSTPTLYLLYTYLWASTFRDP